jgi:hypothetical protein
MAAFAADSLFMIYGLARLNWPTGTSPPEAVRSRSLTVRSCRLPVTLLIGSRKRLRVRRTLQQTHERKRIRLMQPSDAILAVHPLQALVHYASQPL